MEPKKNESFPIFTEIDYNQKGGIAVDYPAYYFDNQIREMYVEIDQLRKRIEAGFYTGNDLMRQKDILKTLENKYNAIAEGRPKLTGEQKDKVAKIRSTLGERIKESMFNHTAMHSGSADAHEEARRMVEPCIPISDVFEGDFAAQAGIKVVRKHISRNDACRIWKVYGKLLGENTDVESLRDPR